MADGNLRILLREHLKSGHWVAVETGATAAGVPDSNYCFPGGKEGWVENKITRGWTVHVRPAQVGWIDRRSRLGGRVFVAIRQVLESSGIDALYLLRGSKIQQWVDGAKLSSKGALIVSMRGFWAWDVRTDGGPKKWDWNLIQRHLVHHDAQQNYRTKSNT